MNDKNDIHHIIRLFHIGIHIVRWFLSRSTQSSLVTERTCAIRPYAYIAINDTMIITIIALSVSTSLRRR